MKPMTILVTLMLAMTCAASTFAQTCKTGSILASTPTNRFTDNADGTVTDTTTNLTWKRCSEGQTWNGTTCTGSAIGLPWDSALHEVTFVVFAGASNWRLPNKNELVSLVERQCFNPAINMSIFPATPASYYWSSSPYGNSDKAWQVEFDDGRDNFGGKTGYNYVRLVRGGE